MRGVPHLGMLGDGRVWMRFKLDPERGVLRWGDGPPPARWRLRGEVPRGALLGEEALNGSQAAPKRDSNLLPRHAPIDSSYDSLS